MPLTLCLIVLGRHVAALEFLDILLGDEPALSPEEKFYQRMLTGDSDEAAYQAEAFLKANPLSAYYDDIAVKGLALAQLDVNRGELDHERRVQIKEAVDAVVDDLSDHSSPPEGPPKGPREGDNRAEADGTGPSGSVVAAEWEPKGGPIGEQCAVLCIAGRGSLDEAVAGMLAQLLTKAGIGARVVPNSAVSTPNLAQLDMAGVRMVCLSYLEPGDFTNARYLVRRLRRKQADARIVVGFWTLSAADAAGHDALENTTADAVVTSLRQAIVLVNSAAKGDAHRQEPVRNAAFSPAE
jgi:hypothetical protein